jgi:hypothetical protein
VGKKEEEFNSLLFFVSTKISDHICLSYASQVPVEEKNYIICPSFAILCILLVLLLLLLSEMDAQNTLPPPQ